MFIFYRLVLAHFIADFPFQTNKIFALKIKRKWGVVLHGCIIGFTSLIFLLPFLNHPKTWSLIILLTIAHTFQDKSKVIYNTQFERDNFWTFIFDEFVHLFIIILVAFNLNGLTPNMNLPCWFNSIYTNDKLIIAGIWYLLGTYTTTIAISYIKKTFNKEYRMAPFEMPPFGLKYLGILERIAIITLVWLSGFYYVLILGVVIPSVYLCIKGKLKPLDLQLSTLIAIVIGFLMQLTV
ncbi:MAG: DUF3307 domain-containing protein [Candidatus Firestonebacteria bacterium]